jgi:hypothetical protein
MILYVEDFFVYEKTPCRYIHNNNYIFQTYARLIKKYGRSVLWNMTKDYNNYLSKSSCM